MGQERSRTYLAQDPSLMCAARTVEVRWGKGKNTGGKGGPGYRASIADALSLILQ